MHTPTWMKAAVSGVALTLTGVASGTDIPSTIKKPGNVSAAIYDAQGRMVRELARAQPMTAGTHALVWDGLPSHGMAQSPNLTLARDKNYLVIQGPHLPKGEIRINYLEAYCRTNSTSADWHDTTIGHTTELVSLSDDKKTMKLRCAVKDGVIVDHIITAGADNVTFAITTHNPTATASGAHWAQPCIRLGDFTGYDSTGKDIDDYLPKCFLFLNGRLTRMSEIKPWIKEARYVPGQVWCPREVPRTDVNPRPLSPLVPSNGLIGCFSGDEKQLFAVAFEPHQELFQGVARCLHSDFRIGGLAPGETKLIRGKIYILPNDVPALLSRYSKDFPDKQ